MKERYHKRQTVSRFVVEAELLGDKGDMEKNGNSNKKNKWTTGKKIKRWKLLKGQVAWCIFTAGTEKGKTTASVGAAVRAAGNREDRIDKAIPEKMIIPGSGSFKADSGDNSSSMNKTVWIFMENETGRKRRGKGILRKRAGKKPGKWLWTRR